MLRRRLGVAALAGAVVLGAASAAAAATGGTIDGSGSPDDTAPPDTAPLDTAPLDTAPLDTAPSTSAEATDGPRDDRVDVVASEREDNVSVWWWIGGGAVAAAAFYGIVHSLRRRRTVEDWAGEAALMCDIGRAMSATLVDQLDTAATWSVPERYLGQHQRFSNAQGALLRTTPDDDFRRLIISTQQHGDDVHRTVASLRPGEQLDTARSTLDPVLAEFATALTALEHEANIAVFGRALPSSRPSS